ncbi:hypothetical protein LA080_000846 [Diaporthe eres]|nr:hypothetical protein LA080_000846 [Diaporthe eres]
MPTSRPRTNMRSSTHQLGGSINAAALIGLLPLPRVQSLDGSQPRSCGIRKVHDTNAAVTRLLVGIFLFWSYNFGHVRRSWLLITILMTEKPYGLLMV